jgi:hypothetical protein
MSKQHKTGFTIIELSLSMVFIAFLLIAVVVLTIRMTDIYSKGNTIKNVTSVGRSVISDFKKVVGASPAPAKYGASTAFFVQTQELFNGTTQQATGRFCTGTHSYLWNTGRKLKAHEKTSSTSTITYNGKPIRLLKMVDSGRKYCDSDKSRTVLTTAEDPNGVDLISSAETNLALYQFFTSLVVDDSAGGQALYPISFVLGTMSNTAKGADDGSIDSAMTCTPPGGSKSEFNYCAINKFDIVVRATGNQAG